MPSSDLDHEDLIKTLTDNFNILADEVQLLSDRKIILEHKLRFAHEQVSATSFPAFLEHRRFYMMRNLALDLELHMQQRLTIITCILILRFQN
jgi:hypothetical protein